MRSILTHEPASVVVDCCITLLLVAAALRKLSEPEFVIPTWRSVILSSVTLRSGDLPRTSDQYSRGAA